MIIRYAWASTDGQTLDAMRGRISARHSSALVGLGEAVSTTDEG
jgi:hypothetical protein